MKLNIRLKKLESKFCETHKPLQWIKLGYWSIYERDKCIIYVDDQCFCVGGRGDEETPSLKLSFVYFSDKLSSAQLNELINHCESEKYLNHEKCYFDISDPAPELVSNNNIQSCLRELLDRGSTDERIKVLIQ